MTGRVGPRIAIVSAIVTLVAGLFGFVIAIVLNVFVFDEFDAYGEVPIPPGSDSFISPPPAK